MDSAAERVKGDAIEEAVVPLGRIPSYDGQTQAFARRVGVGYEKTDYRERRKLPQLVVEEKSCTAKAT